MNYDLLSDSPLLTNQAFTDYIISNISKLPKGFDYDLILAHCYLDKHIRTIIKAERLATYAISYCKCGCWFVESRGGFSMVIKNLSQYANDKRWQKWQTIFNL